MLIHISNQWHGEELLYRVYIEKYTAMNLLTWKFLTVTMSQPTQNKMSSFWSDEKTDYNTMKDLPCKVEILYVLIIIVALKWMKLTVCNFL